MKSHPKNEIHPPTIIDRTGLEARIIPWLAWLERVDGLLYYSTTDWSTHIWSDPWPHDANGDAFMFYPPKDTTIAYDACEAQSNRLTTSIRWELLSEGMENYEYLWLLNEDDPQIGVTNEADTLARQLIDSRSLFSRVPTNLYATRAAIAGRVTGPRAAELTDKPAVAENETFNYRLTYSAGDSAHTVFISDTVPVATTVITASGAKAPAPAVARQAVSWTVPVASQERVTLTIEARGAITTLVTNTATFSGPQLLFSKSVQVMVYASRVYLPVILK
jgi:hypothetical protein